ncbi:transposase [Pseudoroseomonas wenyumeiae]
MADLFWLAKAQIERIPRSFPLSHGAPRVDDRRVFSGIIHVIHNGLRWRNAPAGCGPHKTLCNRFTRWSRMGIFNRIFAGLAWRKGQPEWLMIDATQRKAHRTAASLLEKGLFPAMAGAPRAALVPSRTWSRTGRVVPLSCCSPKVR